MSPLKRKLKIESGELKLEEENLKVLLRRKTDVLNSRKKRIEELRADLKNYSEGNVSRKVKKGIRRKIKAEERGNVKHTLLKMVQEEERKVRLLEKQISNLQKRIGAGPEESSEVPEKEKKRVIKSKVFLEEEKKASKKADEEEKPEELEKARGEAEKAFEE